MRKGNSIDMLNGPLAGKLFVFALPVAIAGILQQLFAATDSMVAGQMVSNSALAAVGASMPVVNILTNVFIGLSVGANALMASHIGGGRPERLQEALHTTIALGLTCGVAMLCAGVALAQPVLELIQTPSDVLGQAVLYLRIYFLGSPFVLLYNFGSAVLRSRGDTRRPTAALAVGVVVNVVLNVACVQLLGWGLAGIAASTTVANGISCAMVLVLLMREEGNFKLRWKRVRVHAKAAKSILAIGVPAGLQVAVFSLANICVQSGINGFGSEAIAGSAAELNYEFVSYYFAVGFGQAAVTFVAQNRAARQYDRCKKAVRLCMVLSMVCAVIPSIIFTVWSPFYIGIFTTNAVAVDYGCRRMVYIEMLEVLTCTYEVPAGAMRGMGQSVLPAVITVVGSCVLRFIWMFWVFPQVGTYESIMVVYPISWVVTGGAMIAAYFAVRKRKLHC